MNKSAPSDLVTVQPPDSRQSRPLATSRAAGEKSHLRRLEELSDALLQPDVHPSEHQSACEEARVLLRLYPQLRAFVLAHALQTSTQAEAIASAQAEPFVARSNSSNALLARIEELLLTVRHGSQPMSSRLLDLYLFLLALCTRKGAVVVMLEEQQQLLATDVKLLWGNALTTEQALSEPHVRVHGLVELAALHGTSSLLKKLSSYE